jgi:hydroxymethylglutaryl-CoA reductase (NADPH)
MDLRSHTTVKERRIAIETAMNVSLASTGSSLLDENLMGKHHCENMIGTIQIPLGIAGPVRMNKFFYPDGSLCTNVDLLLPLATTEAALVASVSRGCKAISESNGAIVEVEDMGATRGPAFHVGSIEEGKKLSEFCQHYYQELKHIAENTSHHLEFRSWKLDGVGPYRYIRFVFGTGDAMGLNMVTIASDQIVRYIEKQTGIRCIAVSGNYCVDKKASWMNVIEHRGHPIRAEVTLSSQVLQTVLKTTAEAVFETWMSKCMIGSALTGTIGNNAQMANVLAAMFIATGQDPAHVTEGSTGFTTTKVLPALPRDESTATQLAVSIYLPDCMIGTIGGGTSLPTQKEAISIIASGYKVTDRISTEMLSAAVAVGVLAGEISLLSSLSEGSLARAHETLARGKNTK